LLCVTVCERIEHRFVADLRLPDAVKLESGSIPMHYHEA